MRIPPLAFAFALCGARVTAAESATKAAPAPASEQRPAIFAPQPAKKTSPKQLPMRRPTLPPPGTQTRRAISPEVAANLSAVATRAAPPVAATPAPTAAPVANGDASDALQLDPFIVNEEKFPEFKERDMLTPEGKLALAHKLNPGLKAGPLSLGNKDVALEMLEELFAQQRRDELVELKSVLSAGGVKPPPEVLRKIDEARTRNNEWSAQPPGTRYREPR